MHLILILLGECYRLISHISIRGFLKECLMKSHQMRCDGGVLVEQIRSTPVKGNNTNLTQGWPIGMKGDTCKLVVEKSRLKLWKRSVELSNFGVARRAETWMCLKMKPEEFSGWCPSKSRHSDGKIACSCFLWWIWIPTCFLFSHTVFLALPVCVLWMLYLTSKRQFTF